MLAIVDYGVGNLFSLKSSLARIGASACVTGDADALRRADRIILPGVGAFGDAAKKLRESGLASVVTKEARQGKPLLGICLGMQLLFEKSYEYGEHEGLGLIEGFIDKINAENLKIPHMGWNSLHITNNNILTKDLRENDYVYFVHSFMANTEEKFINAYTDYKIKIPAIVSKNNVYGCQFHPEKSDMVGMKILRNFIGE